MGIYKNWSAKVVVETLTTKSLQRTLAALLRENDPKKNHYIDAIRKELRRRREPENEPGA